MLIGLCGPYGVGKNAAFDCIQHFYPAAECHSFAEKLKQSCAAALGISRDVLEALKRREDLRLALVDEHGREFARPGLAIPPFCIREFLQRNGTEAHRDVFGQDFWIDQALPLDVDHRERVVVFTDARFPNEFQRIHDLGGFVVKVLRDVQINHAGHASEQPVDAKVIDCMLDNRGSLDDLHAEVKQMMELLESGYRYSGRQPAPAGQKTPATPAAAITPLLAASPSA